MNPAALAGVVAAIVAASGSARRQPGTQIPSGAVLAFVLWLILPPAWIAEFVLLLEALRRGDLVAAATALAYFVPTTVLLFPWPITRRWLIPRGHPRLAWAVSRLSFWVWRGDVRGGALVAASWAAVRRAQRRGALERELLDWFDERLAAVPRGRVRWRLGGAGIIAAGLIAEARGDRAQARRMLASAGELAEPTRPRRAVILAWEWLCAEAATRGAWREVEFLARTAPVESRLIKFFGAAAARLTRIAPLPNDLLLRWRWFAAPRRRATRELLERALATPERASADAEQEERPRGRVEPPLPEGQPLLAAMTLHAHVLGRDPKRLDREAIGRLAQLWDQALADPELARHLGARGEVLGTHAGTADPEVLADVVREDLLGLIRAAGLELGEFGDDSEILGRAARRLHADLIEGLEVASGALESRVDGKDELPALDEWRAFLALREQYAEAASLGGLSMRRLAFSTVYGPICSLAVWLWNDRSERAIGNAMFSWLLAEAVAVDDAEAIRLQERNVNCGV